MKVQIHFFKNDGKLGHIVLREEHHEYRPKLGDAVEFKDERYVVVDVSWDFDANLCEISALYQEPED